MNDVERLCHLIQLHLDGLPLPKVEGLTAYEWLGFLRSDQTPFFSSELASRLGTMNHSPWVCEVAMTLRSRLQSAL
jgi:hypothetical protein